MAKQVLCKIDGCCKPSRKRGWCSMHYARWLKAGDPLATKRENYGGAREYFNSKVLAYGGEDCLIWPFSRNANGYGQINIGGRPTTVSRLVCERTNGSPPTDKHQAAHTCGNGHLGCVSPSHMVWKTHAENQADKIEHNSQPKGSMHHWAKLTEREVLAIRRMLGSTTQRDIARAFGVSEMTISDIKRGRRWSWLALDP